MKSSVFLVLCLFVPFILSKPVKERFSGGYESCPAGEKDKLNVHLVCHTHNDVGWLKTVDQYYYGARNSIQNAGVQYILNSVIKALQADPTKKFIYVETAFFSRWWNQQHDSLKHSIKKLVCNGQLEFIGGGWSMNDEAATHYNSIIDQMTLGLRVLNDTFGKCGIPKVAWQIDPFGHSKEQASLFAQMYFDGLFFGRLDYADKENRELNKTMEHVWKPSFSLGNDLFTGALPRSYSPPPGFCFDILCDDPPIMDDPELKDYNVDERVKDFIEIAELQSNNYATNHIIMTMGNDFNYQNADTWFTNLDKLIKYVNQKQSNGSRVNVFYSTPSCYLHALHQANRTWSTKTDDFFPYASDPHAYWTGYFTSRPSIKGFERYGNNKLQVCKQLGARIDIEEVTLDFMRKAMGIMQHHDAITGTAKQEVTYDYAETLSSAIESCQNVTSEAYEKLMPLNKSQAVQQQVFCNYLNISACQFTEEASTMAVTIYNPLAWNVSHFVRLPVTGKAYKVLDYNLTPVETQMVPIPPPVLEIPGRNSSATMELVFKVELPPLGYATYIVRNSSAESVMKQQASSIKLRATGDWTLKNEFLTVYVDGKTGLLKGLQWFGDGSNLTVNQSFYWYRGMNGDNKNFESRASGAYIFRPNGTEPIPLGDNVTCTFVNGSLVQEVHQVFTPWLSQSIRLYKGSQNVEFRWVVGPIPHKDKVGKEIITRFDTDIQSGGVFFTDSNGREKVQRTRNFRPSWHLNVTEPISGNYYPVNSRIYIQDPRAQKQVTILTDRSQGGSSINNGSIELMVHRRLFMDDAFGVGEALNESGVNGQGLVVIGSHYLLFSNISDGARKHRPLAHRLYLQPEVSFMTYNLSEVELKKALKLRNPGLTSAFPSNVHLLTLEPWKRDTYLIRLEHIYEVWEDQELGVPTNVTLKDRFTDFQILKLDETTLSANQYVEEANRLQWRIQGDGGKAWTTPFSGKGQHKDKALDNLNVHLVPMQIRTFVAKIKSFKS